MATDILIKEIEKELYGRYQFMRANRVTKGYETYNEKLETKLKELMGLK